MTLMWMFMFTLTLAVNMVTSQSCQRLFMQGLDNTQILPYAELSGLYSLTNITFNGFPAYRHETHQNQYFFYNSTRRVLVLGQGLLLAQTSGRLPNISVQYPYSQVITGWRILEPATNSYRSLSAHYIQPRCMDTDPGFRECHSGQLTFNEVLTFHNDYGRTVNITQYQQIYDRYTSYRPIYQASFPGDSIKVYLFHANGKWILGDNYTTLTSAFARVSDTALRPEFITGIWQLHYNGDWRHNVNLKLRCSGIANTTSCSYVQCRNGGTCITAGAQNVRCSCPRGYRGSQCEQRVQSCQHFGNWTANYGGFYYTEDSYEGSLTAWFCAQRSRPQFGYSVCENRFYRPSWSNRPTCQSLDTATHRWTWSRTTRYWYPGYSRRNDRRDPFEDVNAWLTPVVIVCVLLIQIFAPFVIYCILIHCCGYRKKTSKPYVKANEEEEKAIAEKYKHQLEELESRTLTPENTVTISELRRIQQQLEEEIDQLRARRRQCDREEHKTAKLSRIISFYYYISFLLWIIYLIISFAAKLGQYVYLFGILAIIAIICVIALPIVVLIESWSSSERQYIKNLSSLTSATERIASIRNTQPTVCMNAECYHFELRTRTVYYTDANGHTQSRLETYQEKVVTAFIVEPFLFTHWFDSSQSTLTDICKVGITKIKMDLTVQFGDQTTAQHFADKFQQFQDENRYRDVFVNFFVSNTVDGFEKRLAAYTDAGNKPGWISSVWFWLATVFCLGWPYRIMFNRSTGKTEYSIVKVIFTNNPSIQPAPTDPDDTTEPPSENTIENIKKNIQATLDRLTAGLSENDSQMPIKCAATDQHMNVTLREAHHTAQTAT